MRKHMRVPGLLCLSAGLLLSLNNDARCQAAPKPEIRDLEPGVSVEGELAGGEGHQYRIVLAAGEHAGFQVVKEGANVNLTLKDPDGKSLFNANFEFLEHGIETVDWIAKSAGPHILIVEPDFKSAPRGRYRLKMDELREATEHDRRRFSAQLAFVRATELFKQGTPQPREREEAIRKLKEALPVWQSDGDRIWEARTFLWLGWTNLSPDTYASAIDFLKQALEIRRDLRDTAGEAEALRFIGMVHQYAGKFQEARKCYNGALELQKGLGERWQLAFTFMMLGEVHWRLGEYDGSDYYLAEGHRGLRETGDEENEIRAATTRGFIYAAQGKHQPALNYLLPALAFFRRTKNPNGKVAALNNLGLVYYNLGDSETAIKYLNESLSGFRELGRKSNVAYTLINLGLAENSRGYKRKAMKLLNESLRLMREIPNRAGEANALRHIGHLYHEMGLAPKALEHLNLALELARKHGERRVESMALAGLGEVHAAMGDRRKAIEFLDLAQSLCHDARLPQGEARALSLLAGIERDSGAFDKAITYIEKAIDIIESQRREITRTELRASYQAVNQDYYEMYIDLLMRRNERSPGAGYDALALQAGEKARARALLDSLFEAGADIRQGIAPELLNRQRSLQKLLGAAENQWLSIPTSAEAQKRADLDREINELNAELQQTRAQIRATSPRYAALTQPQPLELKEIQAQLDGETLLLVYSLGAKRSFLWAVTPETVKSYVLEPRKKIEKNAEYVYGLLQKSRQLIFKEKAEVAIQGLSRLLLDQVAGELNRKRLVIVADGKLKYIPFAALKARGKGRPLPLIAKHEIVNLPSVSALAQLRRDLAGRRPAPKTLAIFADPVYGTVDPRFGKKTGRRGRRSGARIKTKTERAAPAHAAYADPHAAATRAARKAGLNGFTRLKHSGYEANRIARLVPSTMRDKFTGFNASRDTFDRAGLNQYRILHFALHSLIDHRTLDSSGIVLSLYNKEGRPQDGFLRAHEIYNLELNADLVALSACQTALGKDVRGEGLTGMSRGFMYAGAPSLVVSLWNVDDKATARLMTYFYDGMLKENLSPAATLRAAQLKMQGHKPWTAPYYWAGFALQGEWK